MAEIDLVNIFPGVENVQVDVEMLDFTYIESCLEWKKLLKILHTLKSGKEGFYPELTKVAEEKLLATMPVKERKKYLAISRSASVFEEQEAQREIVDWINNMKSSSISNTEEERCNTILGMLSRTQQAKLLKAKEMLSAGELTQFQLKNRSENERRKGNECFKSRELDSAVNHYTYSISLNFTSDLSWTNRAFVYIKKECYDLAEMDCNVAIFLNEKNIKAYYRRGVARMSLGKYKTAANDFSFALSLDPSNQEIKDLFGKAVERYEEVEGKPFVMNIQQEDNLILCSKIQKCLTDLNIPCLSVTRQVVRSSFGFSGSKESLDASTTYVKISIDESDEESDSEADTINTNREVEAETMKDKGNSYMYQGKYSEALDCYNQSLALNYSLKTLNNRVQAYLQLKEFQKAIEDATEVLGKEHDNSKALFRRAKAFVGIEDYERASDDLTLLLKVDPKSSNGIELLEQVKAHLKSAEENLSKIYKENGNSSMTAGNFHDAINWYTQSIDTDRCNVASYNNRSLAYLKTAQFDLAKSDASFVLKEGKSLVSEGEWKSLAKKALSRKVECGIELAKEIEDSEKKRNELNEVLLDLDALKSIEHDEALISGLEKSINQQLNALTSTTSSPSPSPPSTKAKRSEAKSKSPKDPPKSYYEFERVWKALKGNLNEKLHYLSVFKKSTFQKVFNDTFSCDTFSSLIECLYEASSKDPDRVYQILTAISLLKNFSFSRDLLPKEDETMIKTVFDRLLLSFADSPERAAIEKLQSKFRV